MDTNTLKKFAQDTRSQLIDQITARLELVMDANSPARRQHVQAMADLDAAIARAGNAQVIDKVAYTWFNRFTALRFMDVGGYSSIGVVSPAAGQTRPEILAEAMAGNLPEGAPTGIAALLDGRTPSSDPQGEAYRLLLVHACNQWHGQMPFLFEKLDDYSELLLPEDLLSQTSILAELRKVMTEDACQDVEIIGWLYQFYISEKKDQVFAGLKKNQKITAENIPAATQLFTPHWIVRYLVENSLGRLWLLNRPHSRLADQMDYYIAPEEPETDFLKITKPEDIRICDPAAGSGHMLTYAFDLLYAIYEEEGYDATEIPALILTHNLTGVEIDDRAGALAAFALAMKAAAKLGRRRFLRMEAKPDICVLQNVTFTEAEMQDVAAVVGKDLFTDELRETLGQFEQAKNFGSLIVPKLRDPAEALRLVEARDFGSDLLLKEMQERVIAVLRMAEALSPKYHVVIANPPYMNAKGMTEQTKKFAENYFPSVKSNLFSMFMIRAIEIVKPGGEIGLMTPISWMSLSSFESLRLSLLKKSTITSFVQPEYNAFWESAHVAICAFTLHATPNEEYKGTYINLAGFFGSQLQPKKLLEAIKDKLCSYRYLAAGSTFKMIPGSPIAYWIKRVSNFKKRKIGALFVSGGRNKTHNNEKYLRFVWEVSRSSTKWVSYANGGNFRKYSGNELELIDWSEKAREFFDSHGGLVNSKFWGKEGITWSLITSAITGFRIKIARQQYSSGSPTIFNQLYSCDNVLLGLLNSPVASYYLKSITPTVNTTVNDVLSLPYLDENWAVGVSKNITTAISISKRDWDSYETSWDFSSLPLLKSEILQPTLKATYEKLRTHWQEMTLEMRQLEKENNRIFIDAYGLQDELSAEVPLYEVTLTCNPHYRYGNQKADGDLETPLLADTMREFVSYAVGCMFGRYSPDAEGLILANEGETLEDYLARLPGPTFMPDEDNVIPVLDGDWFPDDITERFRLFLRTTFGEAQFRENLRYIEDALGKDIRKYFTKDFYADHVKRYKKRPIYWMFSSPKGTFNALIYMHRYQSDNVSVLLNDYLREFISKLQAERGRLEKLADDPSASQGLRTKALKDLAGVVKQIDELNDWERDEVFPLAQSKIEIDLDDGVKANYPKFGTALKKIVGVN